MQRRRPRAAGRRCARGCERATREHPLRSSVVHPLTRKNEHTLLRHRRAGDPRRLRRRARARCAIEMIPKGSGSENNSFLKMAIPAEGVDAIKTFVVDCVLAAGGKTCPPTIVGVGVGGTSDLCVRAGQARAPRGRWAARCADADGAALEAQLSRGGQPAGRRPAGPGRRLHRLRGAHRAGRHAHHDEPGRGEHAVPLGAARARHASRPPA
ncbi:MAG: fumarate hydratase [Comamonadaceae bacterium]|nr:fumarate hydratase [Comamonadaceae bacterium]